MEETGTVDGRKGCRTWKRATDAVIATDDKPMIAIPADWPARLFALGAEAARYEADGLIEMIAGEKDNITVEEIRRLFSPRRIMLANSDIRCMYISGLKMTAYRQKKVLETIREMSAAGELEPLKDNEDW